MSTLYLSAPRSAEDAAERLRHAREDVDLPCRDGVDGIETPGLTSDDWADDGPRGADAAIACMSCPVRQQCGDYALAARESYGVWGGMTSAERRTILRRRRRGRSG